MIIKKAGAITPDLHVLGSIDLPAFLIDTRRPALIDAGMTLMGKKYIREAQELLDGQGPAYLFLTHVHYDHCGAAPVLKKTFPEMEICCSEAGAQLLQRRRAIETIKELNRSAVDYFAEMDEELPDTAEFEPFTVDRTLAEGEEVALGPDLTFAPLPRPVIPGIPCVFTRLRKKCFLPARRWASWTRMAISSPNGYRIITSISSP